MRRRLALLLVAAFLVLVPSLVEACSCMVPGPPCQAVWESPLVFAGTVVALEKRPGAMTATLVRFKVTEAFRGAEGGEIAIHLRGGSSASCDPPFRMGETWLVYGNNQWEGGPGWTTSICSRTKLLKLAGEDLRYLRTPDKEKHQSHIEGRVAEWIFPPSPHEQGRSAGIPGVPVTVEGGGETFRTSTDAEGRYQVPVSFRRAYRVTFGPVEGRLIRGLGQEVYVPHPLACGVANAGVSYDGSVGGRVVDANGLPVPFLPIALESTPRYLKQHMLTDAAGTFQFQIRHPGPHFVTASEELWRTPPSRSALSAALTVPVTTHVDAGALRVPASFDVVLAEILIEDSEGKPASGATVYFKQPDVFNAISYEHMPKADERGRFLISLVRGQRYEVMVSYDRNTPAGTAFEEGRAVIVAGLKPVRIRLAPFR